MSLKLRSIIERGNLSKERLTLKAADNIDIGDYAVFQCAIVDGVLTTVVKRTFWFQYDQIEKGDLVVLYTKSGESRSKVLSTGSKAHFFYWGLQNPIWGNDELAAVVLKAPQWESKSVSELT